VKRILTILGLTMAVLIGGVGLPILVSRMPVAFQSWIQVAPSGISAAAGYATIQIIGSALTQETTMNFASGVVGVDNGGSSRTDLWQGIQIANAGSTGTTVNTLTNLTGAPSTAVITPAGATSGVIGITVSGAGTTGTATIATGGKVSCVFDGATTAGDYVQISSGTNGDCHDTGASTYPSSGQVLGTVLSTNGGVGTYSMEFFSPGIAAASGGGGSFSAAPPFLTDGSLFYGPAYTFTRIVNASYAWVNQGSATLTTTNSQATIDNQAQEANFNMHARVIAAPSTPYHIIVAFVFTQFVNSNQNVGIGWRDSASTKMVTFGMFNNSDAQFTGFYLTNETTYAGTTQLNTNQYTGNTVVRWLRMGDNGTNRTYDMGPDGVHWTNLLTESDTTFLTANQVMFYVNSGPGTMQLLSWQVTG